MRFGFRILPLGVRASSVQDLNYLITSLVNIFNLFYFFSSIFLFILYLFINIPFKIERTYWIYDVPGGQIRGGHAFKEQKEFIVALSGSFNVIVDDGKQKHIFSLNRSYYGLYIPKGFWRQMENFSTNSLALVLSSTKFSEQDYIRDYNEYLKYSQK